MLPSAKNPRQFQRPNLWCLARKRFMFSYGWLLQLPPAHSFCHKFFFRGITLCVWQKKHKVFYSSLFISLGLPPLRIALICVMCIFTLPPPLPLAYAATSTVYSAGGCWCKERNIYNFLQESFGATLCFFISAFFLVHIDVYFMTERCCTSWNLQLLCTFT